MKIHVRKLDGPFRMEATNPEGNSIIMDTKKSNGGDEKGMSPTELLLSAVAGCSGVDILTILRKQRYEIRDFQVIVDGEKEKEGDAKAWADIKLHYKIFGSIPEENAKKAIDLSLEKYCSVAKTLRSYAKIHYTFELIP
jgi:putative redox protein